VPIIFDAFGDENAFAFTLNFDPTLLRFVGARLGSQAPVGNLLVNTNLSISGKVGLAFALPPAGVFATGEIEILDFDFVAEDVNTTSAPLAFGNNPVICEIVSALAEPLNSSFLNGFVTISRFNSLNIEMLPNRQLSIQVQGKAGQSYEIEFSTDLM